MTIEKVLIGIERGYVHHGTSETGKVIKDGKLVRLIEYATLCGAPMTLDARIYSPHSSYRICEACKAAKKQEFRQMWVKDATK